MIDRPTPSPMLVAAGRAAAPRALVAALVGMVLTLVVAFGCWALGMPGSAVDPAPGDRGVAWTALERIWPELLPADWPIQEMYWTRGGFGLGYASAFGMSRDFPVLEEVADAEAAGRDPVLLWPATCHLRIEQAGWPLPAFTGGTFLDADPLGFRPEDRRIEFIGSVHVPAFDDEYGYHLGFLPITPHVPGLLANVAFWGTLAFVAIGGPSRVVRAVREARESRETRRVPGEDAFERCPTAGRPRAESGGPLDAAA